jgi:hypothetical protein
VGIDHPDDANVPSDNPTDRTPTPANDGQQSSASNSETRYRHEYYADQRGPAVIEERTEPAGRSEPGVRFKTEEPAENGHQANGTSSWEETAELSRWMWGEYKRRWPPEQRAPVDRSSDPPGSWHGESNRVLNPVDNERIEAQCGRIEEREREKITPALRETESQDPYRHLIGLERCLKGRDRIKEKVYDNMKALTISANEALSIVPDAIRYTFQYEEARYTRGVRADISRLRDQGFKLDKLKNYWSDDQYRGINSHWIEPDTGQRLEVQFHTRISYEAKQITHGAYERIRAGRPDKFEQMVLEAFQKKVVAEVPLPPGAVEIPDYPKRGIDAR